jgi:hypothetical protein
MRFQPTTKNRWPQAALLAMMLGYWFQAAAAEEPQYFRVAEVDGVWWFVAPDGKPFFSSGVNVIDVGGERQRYDPQRPEYAAFRHYRDSNAWADAAQSRLDAWGFNTVGGWSAREMTSREMPYTYVLHLGRELGVPWNDVFAVDFSEKIEKAAARDVAPRVNDPQLIGWFTDNELAWFSDTLFAFHIAEPAKSATRQQLIRMLRAEYDEDFERLQIDFVAEGATNFDELAVGGKLLFRPGGRGMTFADKFLQKVAERFYKTAHDAIRRVDPEHLILGDRYHGFCPDAVAVAAGPYVDVISTNFDQPVWTDGRLPRFYLERLHHLTKRPIMITEYYVAARDNRSGNKNSGDIFTIVDSQAERAAAVRTRLSWFASLPYVVGAHWFQFSDEPTFGRGDGEDYNFGLVDIEDRPYDELVAAFTETNGAVPEIHREAGKQISPELRQQLQVVPAAPADPMAGIAEWDEQRATVPCREASSLGDLLVSADRQKTYVAVSCSTFVDPNAYPAQQPGPSEQHLLRIAVGDAKPCVVRFGTGKEVSVSDPGVVVRVHQRGLRYVVILAVPSAIRSRDPAAQDAVPFAASLEDLRRGDRSTWSTSLVLSPVVREAQFAPAARAPQRTGRQLHDADRLDLAK